MDDARECGCDSYSYMQVGVRAVLVLDPKRVVSRVPSPPRVTVGVVASVLDSQAILHLLEKPETHSGIHVDIRYSPVFGLQASARTPAGCLCKGMGYDSDCRVRPAELLKTSSAGRSPYPWCETAIFDYWGVPCKEDFDLCLPPGEAEAFEKPDDKCTTPCGRDGKHKYDMCRMRGMLFRSEQRCVAALGVTGKVERPDREPEKFEGSMLNFAGAMNKLSVSGRLLTLSPAFDCNFRVTVEWPTSGQLPLGIDGHIRYTPTTETIGDWSSARVNEPFVHEDEEITELHFQLEVKGDAMQFDAVRLEQQCRAHVSGSGQFSDWSLVPHGQLRTPTFTETGSNRGARTSRRLKVSSPSQDSDDDSSDDDTDGARVKLSTCSEFVGVPCIDPATNVQTRCSDNQVCDSNYTAGGGFCRCADGFCWSYTKQACVDQSEHAREVVSKLLDETLLERHSPKLWATAKEVATVGFCAMEAAESLNNILRHVLAIGPGILISAWTAKLIFVQSTIPGYFSYFFTMVYSPAAWVLNNVWHQTASDWRLSLGLAAMAFWTIPVSVVGMKYGLHRPMSVPRAMSLVNNLLLLYYFVLFAAVVFIVMFVFSDEPETEAYFSVSAAFRRKLRPGKLSKTELLYVLTGFLTESFAVFFITCCAATDAFIMVIVKEHQAAWSLLTRGKPLQAVQALSQHADLRLSRLVRSTVCACTSAADGQEMAPASKYTLDINGKESRLVAPAAALPGSLRSSLHLQDPLELLSDDTWEALCCEEITIVPALNTETDVDLISGKLGPLRAHTPLKVKLWAALQYASKHECQIELPHWLEASELEIMCKEERAEPLKFGNDSWNCTWQAWGSESAREKSLLMLTKLIQIRRAKILEGIQAFDATMSTEFKVTGMSAAEITCFRTRSLAFLDTMLDLLNYRLDEKGGAAEAPIEEDSADDEHTLYAIEEQVTRDWLLLMKESSEEDAGLAGPTLNTRLLRDNERSSEPEEAVELTDMVRTRGQEMEEPSVHIWSLQASNEDNEDPYWILGLMDVSVRSGEFRLGTAGHVSSLGLFPASQTRLDRAGIESVMSCTWACHLLLEDQRLLAEREFWAFPPPVSPSTPFGNIFSCLDPVRRVRTPTGDLPAASMDFADIEEVMPHRRPRGAVYEVTSASEWILKSLYNLFSLMGTRIREPAIIWGQLKFTYGHLFIVFCGLFVLSTTMYMLYSADSQSRKIKSASARHILMQSEADILQAKARIEGGESFSRVARALSQCRSAVDGGDLGVFQPGELHPSFDRPLAQA
eukprot:s1139_g26.t3